MLRHFSLFLVLLFVSSCACTQDDAWISLMDESHWKGYLMDEMPSNWVFDNGELSCIEVKGTAVDLITRKSYENFVLELQWNIRPKGNSGIFYHLVEDTKYKGPYQTAPEYQLIDDVNFPVQLEGWQKSGANYAMHPPAIQGLFKGAGEWNTTRIVYDHGTVEHWLNGEKIVSFEEDSPSWKELRASGKWNDFPDYKIASKGPIGLQDHGVGVRFKEIRIRTLD